MNRMVIVISFILFFIAGFFIGRNFSEKESCVVDTSDTVIIYNNNVDTIRIREEKPSYVVKHDTIVRYADLPSYSVDSVLTDYYRVNLYNFDFSSDTTGTYTVEIDVSENKIMNTTATIVPLQKTVTVTNTVEQKVKKFRPFVSVGTDLRLNSQNVTGGVVIGNNYVFSVAGLKCGGDGGYSFNFGYIFR